jgi:hypothetical protein
MLLLGWQAEHLVLLYYFDSIVSFAALAVLAGIFWDVPPRSTGIWPAGSKPPSTVVPPKPGVGKIALGAVSLGGFFAAVGGLPVFLLMNVSKAIHDPVFLTGAGFQVLAVSQAFVATYRQLRGRKDIDEFMHSRMAFMAVRWLATIIVAEYLPFPFLVVVAYAAASVYFELHPPDGE